MHNSKSLLCVYSSLPCPAHMSENNKLFPNSLMLVMIHYIFAEEFLSEGGVWMKEEAVMGSDDIPGL